MSHLFRMLSLAALLIVSLALAGCGTTTVYRENPDRGLNYYTEKADRPSNWAAQTWHRHVQNGDIQGEGDPRSLHNSESRNFRPKGYVTWEGLVAYNERTSGATVMPYPNYAGPWLPDWLPGLFWVLLILAAIAGLAALVANALRKNSGASASALSRSDDGAIRHVTVNCCGGRGGDHTGSYRNGQYQGGGYPPHAYPMHPQPYPGYYGQQGYYPTPQQPPAQALPAPTQSALPAKTGDTTVMRDLRNDVRSLKKQHGALAVRVGHAESVQRAHGETLKRHHARMDDHEKAIGAVADSVNVMAASVNQFAEDQKARDLEWNKLFGAGGTP